MNLRYAPFCQLTDLLTGLYRDLGAGNTPKSAS